MTQETTAPAPRANRPLMAFAWAWVGLPFAYGVYELVVKLTNLFAG